MDKGYTLIELMVVVAIIGIISAIAYPSYQSYACDTYRGQAVADLRVCSLSLERYYSDGFTYLGAVIDDADANSVCSESSPDDVNTKFVISMPTLSKDNYVIQAAPAAGQSCGSGTTIQLSADGTQTEI
ncbi:MAG: type IV pilus assembly protein PilE [Patiriisocius sp.]|jgi:type IV pilus assembly protein PilE